VLDIRPGTTRSVVRGRRPSGCPKMGMVMLSTRTYHHLEHYSPKDTEDGRSTERHPSIVYTRAPQMVAAEHDRPSPLYGAPVHGHRAVPLPRLSPGSGNTTAARVLFPAWLLAAQDRASLRPAYPQPLSADGRGQLHAGHPV